MIVFLDTGVLGIISSPNEKQEVINCQQWLYQLIVRGVQVVSSDLCDYEVRRGILLTPFVPSSQQGIKNLNELESLVDFLSVTQEVWRKAAQLWAESRRQGQPTADSKNIDADVIIAATCQIFQAESPGQNLIVATTNVKHLSHFVMAQTWQEIR
jgi:predicted nucleic acid-binding protein